MLAPIFAARSQRLRKLFLTLHAIVAAEHGTNWILGVGNIIAILGEAEDDPSVAKERIDEAHQAYESMYEGKAGFAEFYIQRENFDEMRKASAELQKVTDAIWKEFEQNALGHHDGVVGSDA